MFEEIASYLRVTKLSDWYAVKVTDMHELGAGGLINNYYQGSLMQALQSIYPHYPWEPKYFYLYSPSISISIYILHLSLSLSVSVFIPI